MRTVPVLPLRVIAVRTQYLETGRETMPLQPCVCAVTGLRILAAGDRLAMGIPIICYMVDLHKGGFSFRTTRTLVPAVRCKYLITKFRVVIAGPLQTGFALLPTW